MPTITRFEANISGTLADAKEMAYWDKTPIKIKEAKKMTETIPMILKLNLLEKDLLFTWLFSVGFRAAKIEKKAG